MLLSAPGTADWLAAVRNPRKHCRSTPGPGESPRRLPKSRELAAANPVPDGRITMVTKFGYEFKVPTGMAQRRIQLTASRLRANRSCSYDSIADLRLPKTDTLTGNDDEEVEGVLQSMGEKDGQVMTQGTQRRFQCGEHLSVAERGKTRRARSGVGTDVHRHLHVMVGTDRRQYAANERRDESWGSFGITAAAPAATTRLYE